MVETLNETAPVNGKPASRIRRLFFGAPRDLRDPGLRHQITLAAFLAWVGLGADGLSSSAYGPEEAFRALDHHTSLTIFLALATGLTVGVISLCYSKIIEMFPQGGGGYMVASTLLGAKAGVVSGAALLVDYVLTITVSIAGGGDAIFSLLPVEWQHYKLPAEFAAIFLLIALNLRGVKESVTALVPIFLLFVLTHALMIGWIVFSRFGEMSALAKHVQTNLGETTAQLGLWGTFMLFVRAYSMGAGTYTGIEAVSNGVAILREPKVATGKRTMLYMSISLAITAAGLLLCYMLLHVQHVPGRTLNALLAEKFTGGFAPGGIPIGKAFIFVTIVSEAVLLLVAAQTGFIGGPRVMANMASDNWLPRRFASLSERLTTQNGILIVGFAAVVTLIYTRGHIGTLVVMYSINVFVTFAMAELGMTRYWLSRGRRKPIWRGELAVHATGFLLCFSILLVMVYEKFLTGGWVTILVTSMLIFLCLGIRRHYAEVSESVREIDRTFANLPNLLRSSQPAGELDPSKPTAIMLVGGYGGLGLHIMMNVLRLFPESFHNFVFVSIGVIDSNFFKHDEGVEHVEQRTRKALEAYVDVAQRMGKPATCAYRIGTDVVADASELCVELSRKYARTVFFAGTLAFDRPRWFDRVLHNETAYAVQRRLKFDGLAMVILPLLLRETKKPSA